MITFKYSRFSFTSCLCDSWSLLSIEVFSSYLLYYQSISPWPFDGCHSCGVLSKTLWLLPVVKREIVGIQVFLAWVAACFLRFKVVAQPWILFVPGLVEISRK